MICVNDIFNYLCEIAPLELQMDFDNSGFQFGRKEAAVHKALLALDVTGDVIEEAVKEKAELIISHHPLLFHAIKQITDERFLTLAENRLAVISMHTNLDIAEGGVNDVLLSLLGAERDSLLEADGCGRIGHLPEAMVLTDFLQHCKNMLDAKGLRFYDAGKPVQRLAVMGGSGGSALGAAFAQGCDTYVTADIKYDQFLAAAECGLNLIDAGHFSTENPVIYTLQRRSSESFPQVDFMVSRSHRQIISFY